MEIERQKKVIRSQLRKLNEERMCVNDFDEAWNDVQYKNHRKRVNILSDGFMMIMNLP